MSDKIDNPDVCTWAEEPDWGTWETSCGQVFEITDGSPTENGMKFCCYCGASLVERSWGRE